ncbi:hypothetical protein CVT25_003398 [Psilocybe cyanescens]|uniref:Ribosomal protein L7/L12 C-terminal domain-containing protein n=1 Tax=Psilocybe cyanescens TaxID=93625 RepID=A0A409WLX1_PSICY|nr:hypothetical protein CVT25_003398 [Psilocybe cyanescens]
MASRCSSILRAVSRPASFSRYEAVIYYLNPPTASQQITFGTRSYSRVANSLRCLATASESKPSNSSTPPPPPVSTNPTITRIVDDISGLTLLQASDLVTQLKARLNIQEIAMPAAGAAAAPAAAAAASDEPAAEKPKEKTVFNVMLESFDAGSKPKVIREVKALVPNLTLMDAKKFVESLPKVLKENLSKEEAEKLQKAFEAIGAVVKLD